MATVARARSAVGVGRFLHFGGGRQRLCRLDSRGLELDDGGGLLVDAFPQPAPVVDHGDRGGAGSLRGRSHQLGLFELALQRRDGVGRGLGRRELLGGVRALGGSAGPALR